MTMTDQELREFEESNWARVDEATRAKCIEHLRGVIPDEQRKQLREVIASDSLPMGFHMFGGMAVRNALRHVVVDDLLPEVEYPDGERYRNWDDFYMAALREAVQS